MQTAPGQTPSQEDRGGSPPATPCSPSLVLGEGAGASPGAGVPPALLTSEHDACEVEAAAEQEQSLLSPPLQKTNCVGCLPPTWLSGAEGWGGNTQAQPTLPGGVAWGTVKKGPPP